MMIQISQIDLTGAARGRASSREMRSIESRPEEIALQIWEIGNEIDRVVIRPRAASRLTCMTPADLGTEDLLTSHVWHPHVTETRDATTTGYASRQPSLRGF